MYSFSDTEKNVFLFVLQNTEVDASPILVSQIMLNQSIT